MRSALRKSNNEAKKEVKFSRSLSTFLATSEKLRSVSGEDGKHATGLSFLPYGRGADFVLSSQQARRREGGHEPGYTSP